MPLGIGLPEMIIVLAIALLVLGPKRLPGAGRSLGNGMREFKEAITGGGDKRAEDQDEGEDVDPDEARESRRLAKAA